MKLYDTTAAPNPRRVKLFLAEKGVELPLEEVSIMDRANRSEEYLAKVPTGHIPALELDDGTIISESPAIQAYIEGKHPEPNLLGSTPEERAVITMWDRRMELGLLMIVAMCFRHSHPRMAAIETQVAEWGASCRERAEAAYRFLNRRLESSPYVAGDRYTVADITTIVALDFARLARIEVDPSQSATLAWREKVNAREAVQRVPK